MSVQITVLALLSLFTTVLPFTLDIYHTNDIHARYDERGPSEGGKCQPDQSQGKTTAFQRFNFCFFGDISICMPICNVL